GASTAFLMSPINVRSSFTSSTDAVILATFLMELAWRQSCPTFTDARKASSSRWAWVPREYWAGLGVAGEPQPIQMRTVFGALEIERNSADPYPPVMNCCAWAVQKNVPLHSEHTSLSCTGNAIMLLLLRVL